MRRYSPVIDAFLIAAANVSPAHAGLSTDDLCTGDPCIIAGDHMLPFNLEPVTIDFGNRAVILAGTLDIGENDVLLTANVMVGDFGSARFEAGCSLGILAGTTMTASPSGFIEFFSGGTMALAGTFNAGEIVTAVNLALDGCPTA